MKRAHITEVRQTKPEDGPFLADNCAWVAIDSAGRKFGGDTEADARHMAESYQSTPRSLRFNKESA